MKFDNPPQYDNALMAIRHALQVAPAVVGWKPGGWVIYNPRASAPLGVEPEILILRRASLPIALSEIGAEVLSSAMAVV